ncbi:hypothetical protein F5888DRAFT_1638609 [Russula emetica]|nr:hypothetical protein F5888DRAFT_1638609 [Russula emetica]
MHSEYSAANRRLVSVDTSQTQTDSEAWQNGSGSGQWTGGHACSRTLSYSLRRRTTFPPADQPRPSSDNIKTEAMSILNGVVAMKLDSMDCDEPSTPLRDPTSSPAVHIQWQNSQSACATMEELRVASSVPRRPPKPLTFDFELPASDGPSSDASDPFFSSRTRLRSARSRNIDRVQSRSQNDVFATPTPAADASKFLDMLGRASARVDENSRKRMKALGERGRGPTKRSLIKGKERLCAKTRGTRSMDELGDHTNFIRDTPETETETRVHYSSLPIMLESQSKDTAAEYRNDVHMHSSTSTTTAAVAAAVPAPGNDGFKPPVSTWTRPQNGTQLFPPRATLSTRHSQKRIEPPSPPVRSSTPILIPLRPVPAPVPAPTPAPAHRPKPSRTSDPARPLPHVSDIHSQLPHPHPVPTTPLPLPTTVNDDLKGAAPASSSSSPPLSAVPMTDSLARHGRSASTSATSATAASSATSTTSTLLISAHPLPSQTHGHGSKRALGMTRTVPRSFSSSLSNNNTPHSAATKKPFRPPLARPAATATASQTTTVPSAKPQIPPTSSRSHNSQRLRRQEDGGKKGSGADPDSSFDISFDFDPEALEAAMKQYD